MLFFTLVSLFVLSRSRPCQPCRKILPGSPNVCHGNANDTFYRSFKEFLPNLETSWGEDDVEIYMPNLDEVREQAGNTGCVHDDSFEYEKDFKSRDFTGSPAYFSWVSKKYAQPILATVRGPACGEDCPRQKGRGCRTFQKCSINDVKHSDYTHSALDRGHIVPNSAIGKWYNKSASTFSMCNIGTQSKRLNEDDWIQLEYWVECLGSVEELVIHAGPLFNSEAFDYCVCEGAPAGSGYCKECKTRAIPMAFGFWKVVVDSNYNAWSWIYTQEECLHDPTQKPCRAGPVLQTIDDAFNSTGLEFIASNLQITWPGSFKQMSNMDGLDAILDCSRAKGNKHVEETLEALLDALDALRHN